MTMTAIQPARATETAEPLELLIKEARAATRRRRLGWFTVFSAVGLVICLIAALIVGSSKPATRIGSGDKNPKGSALAIVPCTTSQLRVTSDRAGWHANFAAAGQFSETLTFTNVANRACQLKGWPHVRAVVNGVTASTPMTDVLQSTRPELVHLAPRGTASFDIFGGDWDPIHNQACPATTNGIMVSPPSDSKSDFAEVEEPFCGGFDISPVIPGRSDHESWSTTVQ
jgi:hypothetical protein